MKRKVAVVLLIQLLTTVPICMYLLQNCITVLEGLHCSGCLLCPQARSSGVVVSSLQLLHVRDCMLVAKLHFCKTVHIQFLQSIVRVEVRL